MTPKRLPPVKHRKPALEPQRKACRCRGASAVQFFADDGEPIGAVLGMILGMRCVVMCDKCGKKWKRVLKAKT